jgi:hypothetical protein
MNTIKITKTLTVIGMGSLFFFSSFQYSHNSVERIKRDLSGVGRVQPKKVATDIRLLVQELTHIGSARAGGSYTQTMINLIRESIGMTIGYSSQAEWMGLTCSDGNVSNCPPQNGIVGLFGDFFSNLKDVAANAGIVSCDQIPSTGSITANDAAGIAWTINFETPTHHIPAPWVDGGSLFQKRVAFTIPNSKVQVAQNIKAAFEFNCGDSSAQYVVFNMPQNNPDDGYKRYITVFTGAVDANRNGIESYLAEFRGSDSKVRGATAIRIEYNPSDSTFRLVSVLGNGSIEGTSNSGTGYFLRSIANGNYATGDASLLVSGLAKDTTSDGNNFYYDTTFLNSHNVASGTGLNNNGEGGSQRTTFGEPLTTTFSGNSNAKPNDQQELYYKGCINFLAPTVSPVNANDCVGMPLSAPGDIPFIGSGGDFSIKWILNHIVASQEVLS